MSDTVGISPIERWTPVMHPSAASTINGHISDDTNTRKIELINRKVKDLFR
jgi:hypothetical protein